MKVIINGEVTRSFLFPADVATAFEFYSDLKRMVKWLPHIALVEQFAADQFRMLYHSTELGVYRVQIYCDLCTVPDWQAQTLFVKAVNGRTPVEARADLHALIAQGTYASESVFQAEGEQTRIQYHLALRAELPIPLAARLIFPQGVVDFIAHSIMHHRMGEIAEGFIEKSLAAYQRRQH